MCCTDAKHQHSSSRSRYQRGHCLSSPVDLKAWITCLWRYCLLHLSLTTGGKKQQMFSDWPVPLALPQCRHRTMDSTQTRNNHNTTKDSWKPHVLPAKMFVIQKRKKKSFEEQRMNNIRANNFWKKRQQMTGFTQVFNDFSPITIKKERLGFFCFVLSMWKLWGHCFPEFLL